MIYPRAFSHIGITVPDLDKAVEFYTNVLGFYLIMPPTLIREDPTTAIGIMCQDVFGAGYRDFRIAHMATSDKIGVELFEFAQTKLLPKPEFKPFQTGLFHFCVQDPNVEELVEKIVAAGGKQRMPVRYYYPGEKPYRMVYCEDPFGNILEIYSHSYELTYAAGAYN
jgi:lactoylglutathione lyase family protein